MYLDTPALPTHHLPSLTRLPHVPRHCCTTHTRSTLTLTQSSLALPSHCPTVPPHHHHHHHYTVYPCPPLGEATEVGRGEEEEGSDC